MTVLRFNILDEHGDVRGANCFCATKYDDVWNANINATCSGGRAVNRPKRHVRIIREAEKHPSLKIKVLPPLISRLSLITTTDRARLKTNEAERYTIPPSHNTGKAQYQQTEHGILVLDRTAGQVHGNRNYGWVKPWPCAQLQQQAVGGIRQNQNTIDQSAQQGDCSCSHLKLRKACAGPSAAGSLMRIATRSARKKNPSGSACASSTSASSSSQVSIDTESLPSLQARW